MTILIATHALHAIVHRKTDRCGMWIMMASFRTCASSKNHSTYSNETLRILNIRTATVQDSGYCIKLAGIFFMEPFHQYCYHSIDNTI